MSKKTKRNLPSVYLDEHLSPDIGSMFRPIFRTIEISKHMKLKGRDELAYLRELYADNGMLITGDLAFINQVRDNSIRHAGIIYIPSQMEPGEKTLFAEIAGGFVQGACSTSRFALRNRIIYPAYDGLRSIVGERDELEFSWDWLSQMSHVGR